MTSDNLGETLFIIIPYHNRRNDGFNFVLRCTQSSPFSVCSMGCVWLHFGAAIRPFCEGICEGIFTCKYHLTTISQQYTKLLVE